MELRSKCDEVAIKQFVGVCPEAEAAHRELLPECVLQIGHPNSLLQFHARPVPALVPQKARDGARRPRLCFAARRRRVTGRMLGLLPTVVATIATFRRRKCFDGLEVMRLRGRPSLLRR